MNNVLQVTELGQPRSSQKAWRDWLPNGQGYRKGILSNLIFRPYGTSLLSSSGVLWLFACWVFAFTLSGTEAWVAFTIGQLYDLGIAYAALFALAAFSL